MKRDREADAILFMDALADYIDASIQYKKIYPEWANADPLLKSGSELFKAIMRLIREGD
jgi:hypothetical protein